MLSGAPTQRPALVDFANNISKGISLLVCGHVIVSPEDNAPKTVSAEKVNIIYHLLNKRRVKGFYNYVTARTIREGALSMMQTVGLGKLKPNTLLMGFKSDWNESSMVEIHNYVDIIQ